MPLDLKRLFICTFMGIGVLTSTHGIWAQEKNEGIRVGFGAICLDVQDRAPVGADTVFNSDVELLYCFTRIEGAKDSTTVTHLWYYGETKVSEGKLSVRSARWRTYSKKEINPKWTGRWNVVVLSEVGDPLAQLSFLIQAPQPE